MAAISCLTRRIRIADAATAKWRDVAGRRRKGDAVRGAFDVSLLPLTLSLGRR